MFGPKWWGRNCETFEDYFDLIDRKDVDIVIIATPSKYHYQMAKATIKAGKHVIIEKPIAPTLEKAYELRDIAIKSKTIAVPFFNFRFVKEYLLIGCKKNK